jgi:hypothetical protein
MSAKLRDEIEAKRLKLQELRQARLARQKQDSERRTAVRCTFLPECITPTNFPRHPSGPQHKPMSKHF